LLIQWNSIYLLRIRLLSISWVIYAFCYIFTFFELSSENSMINVIWELLFEKRNQHFQDVLFKDDHCNSVCYDYCCHNKSPRVRHYTEFIAISIIGYSRDVKKVCKWHFSWENCINWQNYDSNQKPCERNIREKWFFMLRT